MTLVVPAPAKLNLFLHVTGRRADGYHLLESLFVPIDFGDTLKLSGRSDGVIARVDDVEGVPVERDLAVRAARALQEASGTSRGVDIGIAKRIPLGGGLGGGSSDAASVLLALNRLWGLGLPRSSLAVIGLRLGADVPFFIGGTPALARGVGEILTPVSLPPMWATVWVPPVGVPTAAIFADRELTRNTASAKIEIFSEGYGRNDLEPVAVRNFPDVAVAVAGLQKHSVQARMTGSGGCVYAIFEALPQAQRALASRPRGFGGFVARTLSRHPLAGFA